MPSTARRCPWVLLALPFLFLLLSVTSAMARHSSSPSRLRLTPRFFAGQVFRYSIHTSTDSVSHSRGPIADPEGATRLTQSVNVLLRFEVLSVAGAPHAPGAVRIRATYEKATGATSGDSYDPGAGDPDREFQRLQGRSIEFTLHADGQIGNVTGLRKIVSNPSRAAAVSQWLSQLTLGASLPKEGIAVGEKWSSEQPLENVPLKGLAWRTESTYLRDEPCPGAALRSSRRARQVRKPASGRDECAMILTRSRIVDPLGKKDRTPEVYLKNGLRTFGEWNGQSEGLTAVSLRTGMVSSVTQSGSMKMDFVIMTAAAQNRMRYRGEVDSQSQITLLSQSKIP